MWLVHGLTPSFKTIADFRKDHPEAIVSTCRQFIQFCREQSLLGGEVAAIDGTKIEAVASRKQVITPASLEKAQAALDRKIAEPTLRRWTQPTGRRRRKRRADGPGGRRAGLGGAAQAAPEGRGPDRAAEGEGLKPAGSDRAGGQADADRTPRLSGRLQCADGGRCRAQADRGLRPGQRRQRPAPAASDGSSRARRRSGSRS